MSGRRWLLVTNARAGQKDGRRRIARLERRLREVGDHLIVESPASRDELVGRLRDRARDFDVVLALGGDGTATAAAEGLLGTGLPLGVLPGGTVNVLARELGLPMKAGEALERLLRAEPRRVDVGWIDPPGRPFLLMASAGPDAEILRSTDPGLKRRIGGLAVVVAGLRKILTPPPPLRVRIGDTEVRAALAVVSNFRFYGGPWAVAPGADPDDGRLEVVVLESLRRRDLLGFFAGLPFGRHLKRPDISVHVAEQVEFLAADESRPVAIQADGDVMGSTPVTLRLERDALTLLVPTPGQ